MPGKRQKEIIQLLISRRRSVTNRELADLFQVTDRTIRNDINHINREYLKQGRQILSGTDGYHISRQDISFFSREIESEEVLYPEVFESPRLRSVRMLFRLLWMSEPVIIDDLAESMYSSRTTTIKDLRAMQRDWLDGSGVTLENGRYGLKIAGEESRIRDLIGRLLFEAYEKNEINTIRYILSVQGIAKEDDFIWLYDHLIDCLNRSGIFLTDRGMYLFTLENLIMISRIREGFLMEEEPEDTMINLPDLGFEILEEHFDVFIDELEKNYIAVRIAGRNQLNIDFDQQRESYDHIVDEYMTVLHEQYRIGSDILDQYREGLSSHLFALIERIRQNIQVDATMANDIRIMYPYAFECSSAVIPIIQKHTGLNVTEGEIGYIAVHLAVILESLKRKVKVLVLCASGVGTGMLIKKRLNENFGSRIMIAGPYPLYQMKRCLNEDPEIELIVSTVPVMSRITVPVLQISPLLDENDIQNLKHYLIRLEAAETEENTVDTIMDNASFHIFENGEDQTVMLEIMAADLEKAGKIPDAGVFLKSVREREQMYSTVYGRIWLPHPMRILALDSGISCAVVRRHPRIDLIFMLAVRREDTAAFNSFYNHVLTLLDNPEQMKKLLSARDFDAFLETYHSL